jgi:hypothetical protein
MQGAIASSQNYSLQTIQHMENKFKAGDIVYERIRPSQKLIISRFAAAIYHCKTQENHKRNRLFYFERELTAFAA